MLSPPAELVTKFLPRRPEGLSVLDLACGRGRHTRFAIELGHLVSAVDIDVSGLSDLEGHERLHLMESDLENRPWPFHDDAFDAVIVTNYLWRPLLPLIGASVCAGGLLIYETFAVGNEKYGKPSNPVFLLRPGELRETFSESFEVLHFREGLEDRPKPSVRQSIVARKRGA